MHLAGPLIATTPRLAMTSTPNQPPPSDALDEPFADRRPDDFKHVEWLCGT